MKTKTTYKNFSNTCNAVHREKFTSGNIYITKDERSQISNLLHTHACMYVDIFKKFLNHNTKYSKI